MQHFHCNRDFDICTWSYFIINNLNFNYFNIFPLFICSIISIVQHFLYPLVRGITFISTSLSSYFDFPSVESKFLLISQFVFPIQAHAICMCSTWEVDSFLLQLPPKLRSSFALLVLGACGCCVSRMLVDSPSSMCVW